MSFSEKDRKVRAESGRRFPIDPLAETQATLASVVSDALKQDFGGTPGHAKHIAQLMGVSPRTVKNWLQSQNGPNGAGLIVLMRHSDAVATAVLELADRRDAGQRLRSEQLRKQLRSLILALLDFLGPE
ncbi:hypothetical protein [Sphingomonas psychrotolerans]|uniref:Uncharacterized protein n=1 Tax=Sphingomonas psychrotolerans TaxID=1327635 RepID=A0A2K8M9P7_9SPHN|nr:hypothetical protein [Sphingomonas psychrotolerans]ATY30610.1 hypothetical protein CVN68_00210 [Sphingomonas psychrotolerans]